MTVFEHADERPAERHPLLRGASPTTVREWLLPEDRPEFDAAWAAALDVARDEVAVAPVLDMIEEWRRRAMAQSDPAAFRTAVRTAAELFTGEPIPDDEPFAVTREKAGM